MELTQAYKDIEKNLEQTNQELKFKKQFETENSIAFSGEKGIYRLVHDSQTNILSLECAYENNGEQTEFNTISRSLFELDVIDDRDIKSTSNEIVDELEKLFKVRKQVNLEKVKMPKSVSRTKAKNGIVSYDIDSLANRFGTLYPEFKDEIKANVVANGEFLPEDFFINHGTPKVLDVIKNGSEAERKKLFKMLNEVYEDGINDVQDVIAVTILGEMKNDKEMMAVADKYMTEYMAGAVHEVNKLTAKKNRFTKKLKNPPAYKPKKKKSYSMTNQLGGMQ
ncbi:hypothetical protein [uncultured Eubacterium sp.]|uniref:DUF7674 family protein n=1 Tax=uncultured Eubacterium sp. TaxID=165185 RepID=UPI0015BA1834|nr:hypothetical protein [uncultured Eubacterium sp.]